MNVIEPSNEKDLTSFDGPTYSSIVRNNPNIESEKVDETKVEEKATNDLENKDSNFNSNDKNKTDKKKSEKDLSLFDVPTYASIVRNEPNSHLATHDNDSKLGKNLNRKEPKVKNW